MTLVWAAVGCPAERRDVARRKLSPSEIVERLRVIEALTAEGQPIAGAIRAAGVLQAEYDLWRVEYGGLLRTLGPLASSPSRPARRWRRVRPSS